MECGRCSRQSATLGGVYGGVVCVGHRICPECWWETLPLGARQKEGRTRLEPLGGEVKLFPKCIGCLRGVKLVK